MSKKHKAPKAPERVEISAEAYDRLRKLTEWLDAMPDYIDLSEDTLDQIDGETSALVETELLQDFYIASVQIETEATVWRNTYVGALVALVESEASIEAGEECEQHVLITRGLPARKPAKKVTKKSKR